MSFNTFKIPLPYILFCVGLVPSKINASITKAKNSVKKLDTIRKIIKVTESGIRLAAAIITKDPVAITKASVDLYQKATA